MLIQDLRDGVLYLTIDRPTHANALSRGVFDALHDAFERISADVAVKVVVLGSSGTKVFSAGADLKELARHDASDAPAPSFHVLLTRSLLDLLDCPKPVVARLQGPAVGGGLMLAAACDEIIAVESAWVSLPEIKIGMPTPIGAAMLAPRASRSVLQRLVQRGERLTAKDCLAVGVVDAVVSAEGLDQAVSKSAVELASIETSAFAANKNWLNREVRANLLLANAAEDSAHVH
jgi:enoyl-CoA hydratase/carnithine racemase